MKKSLNEVNIERWNRNKIHHAHMHWLTHVKHLYEQWPWCSVIFFYFCKYKQFNATQTTIERRAYSFGYVCLSDRPRANVLFWLFFASYLSPIVPVRRGRTNVFWTCFSHTNSVKGQRDEGNNLRWQRHIRSFTSHR